MNILRWGLVWLMLSVFSMASAFQENTGLPNRVVTSAPFTVTASGGPVQIMLSNCTSSLCLYSINGGPFTSEIGTVRDKEYVQLRMVSAMDVGETRTVNLIVAAESYLWAVRSVEERFREAKVQPLDTLVTSNEIAIQGTGRVSIGISHCGGANCEYSVNKGPFTPARGTANQGDTVAVRMTSAATPATTRNLLLEVGGTTREFVVTTGDDATPAPFAFVDIKAPPDVGRPSGTIVITGLKAAAAINIPVCDATSCAYSINDAAFVSAPGQVKNNDKVTLFMKGGSPYGSKRRTMVLSIGGVKAPWSIAAE